MEKWIMVLGLVILLLGVGLSFSTMRFGYFDTVNRYGVILIFAGIAFFVVALFKPGREEEPPRKIPDVPSPAKSPDGVPDAVPLIEKKKAQK